MTVPDRRKMERFPLRLTAKCLTAGDTGKKKHYTLTTQNICSGGAFFVSKEHFPVGTRMDIDVALPLGRFKNMAGKMSCIKVSGCVIRPEVNGIAVSFGNNYKILPV